MKHGNACRRSQYGACQHPGPAPPPASVGPIAQITDQRVDHGVVDTRDRKQYAGDRGRYPHVSDEEVDHEHIDEIEHRGAAQTPDAPARLEKQGQACGVLIVRHAPRGVIPGDEGMSLSLGGKASRLPVGRDAVGACPHSQGVLFPGLRGGDLVAAQRQERNEDRTEQQHQHSEKGGKQAHQHRAERLLPILERRELVIVRGLERIAL